MRNDRVNHHFGRPHTTRVKPDTLLAGVYLLFTLSLGKLHGKHLSLLPPINECQIGQAAAEGTKIGK